MMQRLAARTLLLAFAALSGAYGLLAYLPFTYQQVIRFPVVTWLPTLMGWHSVLFLTVLAVNLAVDRQRLRSLPLAATYGVLGLLGAVLLIHSPFKAIRNDGTSLALAVASWVLPVWLLVLDLHDSHRVGRWQPGTSFDARRMACGACGAALFLAILFPALAHLRHGLTFAPEAGFLLWNWTLWANLLVCLAAASLMMGLLAVGRMADRPWVEPGLAAGAVWLALASFIHAVVFRAIGFQGWLAVGSALMAALLGVTFLVGLSQAYPPDPEEAALDVFVRSLIRLLRGRVLALLLWLLGLAALGGFLLGRAAVFDWNFLFQKTLVVALGALAFAGLYAALPPRPPKVFWAWALILLPILAMRLFLLFDEGLQARSYTRRADRRLGPILNQEAGADVDVVLLRELLTPVRAAQQSIYRLLQKNSNLPRSVPTPPIDIQHVENLQPVPGPKPDIFIFVVDSLRRDYLGAFNPAVTFTPELDRFAAESFVLRNAFTRYGATGLSEPSIWTGGAMLHKQYITPFYPMNSLQKLLEADGYRGLVSMDTILQVVVKPGPWVQDLDPGVGTADLRLGPSLTKLAAAMATPDPRPLFAYSQCQDIHISVINREGRDTVTPGNYAGFYAPYASRLHRLDADFGRFIAFLKAQGRFDKSIIIFTADHGDSLGEEGRFGHAYTLFPEIVRIPMLIHLPPALAQGVQADLDRPGFLVDLTPTLYYLLGHRPVKADPNLGRPLFTATPGEQAPYARDHYLLTSSYGAVFGILQGSGRSLYIADGINFKDHLFALEPGLQSSPRPLSSDAKQRYDRMIVEGIREVNQFYHFDPGP